MIIKTKEPKFDFRDLFKRISTWVGLVTGSAMSVLSWYFTQPPEVQQHIPTTLIAVCSWLSAIGSAVGVPLATSFRQKGVHK